MSSPGVVMPIPTIGTVVIPAVAVAGLVANRPAPTGKNGFYYAVDQGSLYFDLGLGTPGTTGFAAQWVSIFGGGPVGT